MEDIKEEILTSTELATFLKVSRRTISNLVSNGAPHFRVGKDLRFEKELIMKWLKTNTK